MKSQSTTPLTGYSQLSQMTSSFHVAPHTAPIRWSRFRMYAGLHVC